MARNSGFLANLFMLVGWGLRWPSGVRRLRQLHDLTAASQNGGMEARLDYLLAESMERLREKSVAKAMSQCLTEKVAQLEEENTDLSRQLGDLRAERRLPRSVHRGWNLSWQY